MIAYKEALNRVLSTAYSFGSENVLLNDTAGRILDEIIVADRDFPPFNRVTMDGIAIRIDNFISGQRRFALGGMARAGSEQVMLTDSDNCVEVTTGCILPVGCDTVIPYEHLKREGNYFTITNNPTKDQYIHKKGSDALKDSTLLLPGARITGTETAVLATVGKGSVKVKRNPRVTIIATGDELIPVGLRPEIHQIRISNTHTLHAALNDFGIIPEILHIKDNPKELNEKLFMALTSSDALILSGGVSMGKFDFLPAVLEELGVQCLFHRVAQRPGKPFWFGTWESGKCTVFSLPGNPVSTFLNYVLYFKNWLHKCWNIPLGNHQALALQAFENKSNLTLFLPVGIEFANATRYARKIPNNGSGDFLSLRHANGFVILPPEYHCETNSLLTFIPLDFRV